MTRIAMQPIVSTATPDHTSARRWVIVWAIKSLLRMRKQPFNTNQREHANVVAVLGSQAFGLSSAGGHLLCAVSEDALRTAHTTALDVVASAGLSGKRESKTE